MLDRISIHGTDSQALRDHVTERLQYAVGQHEAHVKSIAVTLADVNGRNKGGVDRRTNIVVHLKEGADVIVEETGEDAYATVHTAADRLKQAIGRKVDKLVDRHHHHAPSA